MQARILGMHRMDFTTAEGRINGTKVHYAYPDENVKGLAVNTFFVSADNKLFTALEDAILNTDVDISFNQKGKVVSIQRINNGAAKA
jgi:hypothetical protein